MSQGSRKKVGYVWGEKNYKVLKRFAFPRESCVP